MILLEIPIWQCRFCFVRIEGLVIENKTKIKFEHPLQDFIECIDAGKTLAIRPIEDFYISVFND